MSTILKILLGVGLASVVWYYFTLYRPEHRVEEALQRKYRDELLNAQKQIDEGKKADGLASYGIAKLQHEGDLQKLSNPLSALPRNCPDNFSANNETGHVQFDFSSCTGELLSIGVPTAFRYRETKYRAILYTGNLNDPSHLGLLAEKPKFIAFKTDHFSTAVENSDGTWTLKGPMVRFVRHGGNILMLDIVR